MNTFSDLQWIQLATYGIFDHPNGKQLVTKSAAQQLSKQFTTLLHRFGWKYVPVYVGHPDDPTLSHLPEHMNTREYGRVKHFKADENGIWVIIKWTKEGLKLIQERQYRYLSPRWVMKPRKQGYIPLRLLSVGLTNQPNLPVQAIEPEPAPTVRLTQLYQSRAEKQDIVHFSKRVQQRMLTFGESYPEAWHRIAEADDHELT